MAFDFKIYRTGTPAALRARAKLDARLEKMEKLDSETFRSSTQKVFGKTLNPAGVVNEILASVRARGDSALFEFARKIDGVKLNREALRIGDSERIAAYERTSHDLRGALKAAIENVASYQQRLMPTDIALESFEHGPSGLRSGMSWHALRRVGIYVPGGTAAYPSSVVMNVVPAQVAGVKEIAVATPCDREGRVSDGVLCACELLGIKEIYRIGGAQAIGAMAYGTRSIQRVDKIIGPGNLFVMLAKRAVFGQVDIDMLAGPSEILVLAQGGKEWAGPEAPAGCGKHVRADWIAADLLSQAEHDVLASCILVTDSEHLARKVQQEIARQLLDLPRREIARQAIRDWGLALVTQDTTQSIAIANELAPEHLEVFAQNPYKIAPKLTSAGAIFLGAHATEPLGDYLAGPSHTLPTGGTARAFSGVSVYTFLRRSSLIDCDAQGLKACAEVIETLARAEGLEAHRRAVACRR